MGIILNGCSLYLLCGLYVISEGFQCNYINKTEASIATPEMLGKQICKAEDACVTNMLDGILTMGCLDSVAHWDHIDLCFSASTTCSYDSDSLAGFLRWGTGMCCCRQDSCNELPPEWLALPMWRFRWRAFSIYMIVFTFFSIGFLYWGKVEGQKILKKEKKRKKILKIDTITATTTTTVG